MRGSPTVGAPEARAVTGSRSPLAYVGAVLALAAVQRGISELGGAVARRSGTSAVDPGGWWAALSVHHLVQGLLGLALLLVLARTLGLDVALRVGDARRGLVAVGVVVAAYAAFLAVLYGVVGVDPVIAVPTERGALLGYLGFQLLGSGPSEELVFRALPLAVLAGVAPVTVLRRPRVSLEVLVAAVLFALAHVVLTPAGATADAGQLATAFVLGTVQGVVLQRTRSVLYPMAIHSLANVLAVGAAALLA